MPGTPVHVAWLHTLAPRIYKPDHLGIQMWQFRKKKKNHWQINHSCTVKEACVARNYSNNTRIVQHQQKSLHNLLP